MKGGLTILGAIITAVVVGVLGALLGPLLGMSALNAAGGAILAGEVVYWGSVFRAARGR